MLVTTAGGQLTKQQQFLWIVQTALLVNLVNQTLEWTPGSDRSNVSMTGNWGGRSLRLCGQVSVLRKT